MLKTQCVHITFKTAIIKQLFPNKFSSICHRILIAYIFFNLPCLLQDELNQSADAKVADDSAVDEKATEEKDDKAAQEKAAEAKKDDPKA